MVVKKRVTWNRTYLHVGLILVVALVIWFLSDMSQKRELDMQLLAQVGITDEEAQDLAGKAFFRRPSRRYIPAACYDGDGGFNIAQRGSMAFFPGGYSYRPYYFYDSCVSTNQLREYECARPYNPTTVTCANQCTNGACVVRCGDGVKEGTEQCDDGNTADGDGCSYICAIEPFCGDSAVNQPNEECDDGNQVDSDVCSNTCVAATCSDNIQNQDELNVDCGGICSKCSFKIHNVDITGWGYKEKGGLGFNLHIDVEYLGPMPTGDYALSFPVKIAVPNVQSSIEPYFTVSKTPGDGIFSESSLRLTRIFTFDNPMPLLEAYSGAQLPLSIKILENTNPTSRNYITSEPIGTTLFEKSYSLAKTPVPENKIYTIGVVQVVPPGLDISTLDICLDHTPAMQSNGLQGYEPFGVYPAGTCPTTSMNPGTGVIYRSVIRTHNFKEIFFSQNPFTSIPDVRMSSYLPSRLGDVNIYSLLSIGSFWENLLAKHGLTNRITTLGINPKFNVIVLPPIERVNTLTSSEHGAVKTFFDDAAASAHLDLSTYDFTMYVQYYDGAPNLDHFGRGFAANTKSYIPIELQVSSVVVPNSAYLTIVHEMGHQLFSLSDLYVGFGLQSPKGVPNPDLSRLPLKQGCIMGKSFGYKQTTPSSIQAYTSYLGSSYDTELNTFVQTLEPFSTVDPENYVLCADDIVGIRGDFENLQCKLSDFYTNKCHDCSSGTCEPCTSFNYLKCTLKQP